MQKTYLVTGASGAFGRIAVGLLAARGLRVIAGARDPAKVADLAGLGAEVRLCDYDRPETLHAALEGVDRLLFVSGSEVGRRIAQHEAVIAAACTSGCERVAYTSILHGEASPLTLADEHKATERMLATSGLKYTVLRNAWYSENFQPNLAVAEAQGAIFTAAGDGRFAPATRAELAEAAVNRLTSDDLPAVDILELAGSSGFSMPEFATLLSAELGKPVACVNMPQSEYAEMLKGIGLPDPFADILAQSEIMAAQGAHVDDSHTLERLIGRAPLTLPELVQSWFRATQSATA